MSPYTLRVNGVDHVVNVDEHTALLHVLRNDLGLTGTKTGCDAARQCGACAVLCDGEKIASCSTPISTVGGKEITTIEGIGGRSNPTKLQLAFFEEQASQCGYCIPGMIVGATALLNKNPNPTEQEIRAALDRHICRCGTHPRIMRAVRRAADQADLSAVAWPRTTTSIVTAPGSNFLTGSKPLDAKLSDAWLSIDTNGKVTAYSGKVDMGTGLRTALIQIVADELDVDISDVSIVLSDTGLSPYQGKSTASCGVAVGGQPLRIAACEVRAELIGRASDRLAVDVSGLDAKDGRIFIKAKPDIGIPYGELVGNVPLSVPLEIVTQTHWGPQLRGTATAKPRDSYRYVGKAVRRDVVADHVLGTFNYVHNVTVPNMLHGRVVRPPEYFARLLSVDESSVRDLPGVRVVRRESFLGVVAEREEIAIEAAKLLKATWTRSEPLYDENNQFAEMRQARVVAEQQGFNVGNVDEARDKAARIVEGDFHFGYQLHAMIGPSCAVADVGSDRATIWSGTQWPGGDQADIANMLGLPVESVRLIYREAAGSYGRLGCDDAAADAALMSQIVKRPVRVQWSRSDENGWEPVSTAMSMNVRAFLDSNGNLSGLDYTQWTSTHASAERGSYVAWNLIGTAPGNDRLEGYLHGLHYELENKRGRTIFLEPTLRTIYLRGPGSVQSHFAVEAVIDELARAAGVDPIEYRMRYLPARDQEVLRAVAALAGRHEKTRKSSTDEGWLFGRGVAYTRSGLRPTHVGVIIDLRVDSRSGRVEIEKVFMAHDCGYMVNPDGVLNQVQGNIVHALSRALFEEVHYTRSGITTLDWNAYGVIRFGSIPEIEIDLIQRPDLESAVVGETSSIPMVAAVANAIFDATGKRLRIAPFTPARVLAALNHDRLPQAAM